MLNLPILRWGQPYASLEQDTVAHFITGETLAKVSQANTGLLGRDMRQAHRAREVLTAIPIADLIEMMKKAGDLYLNAALPMGDGEQSPDDFARQQSASTGLPEHMCKANMKKNHFVLSNMDQILDALTRGLPLDVLTRGYGVESRGVTVSYQSQSPVLGLVLPSNSPGVHTLWLPVIPMQIGLLLKPGPQEPWTPYRMAAAFTMAGVPKEAIAIYPGLGDVGAEVVRRCGRSMIFGGTATVERYKGDPRVQVHGPGFSKILLGDDVVDLGVHDETSADYPQYGAEVGREVVASEGALGIVVCGTGIGIGIAANKVPGVRAAIVHDSFTAEMARAHNNAHVIALGARVVGPGVAETAVKMFRATPFAGGRHQRRVDQIGELEIRLGATRP